MNSSNFFYPLSGLINVITSAILGIIVLYKNRTNIRNITYALFCLSITVWGGFYFIWLTTDSREVALLCSRGFMAGAIFIPIFYLHHIFTLLGVSESKRRELFWIYMSGVTFLIFNMTPYYITGVVPTMSFKFWPTPGILFNVSLAIWLFIVIYGVIFIARAYRNSIGIKRNQMRYVLIAAIIGWSGGSTNFPLWYGIPILPVGNILVSVYVIITAYAIINYRLMDIEVVVRKTVIFAGIFAFVFTVFAGITFLIQEFLITFLGDNVRYAILFFSVFLITIGIRPLERFLINITDNILFQRKYDYQKTLKEASEGMTLVTDMKKLLNLIVRVVSKSIRVKTEDGGRISLVLYESISLVEVLISNFDPTDPFDTRTPEEFAMMWVGELLKANLSNEAVN